MNDAVPGSGYGNPLRWFSDLGLRLGGRPDHLLLWIRVPPRSRYPRSVRLWLDQL